MRSENTLLQFAIKTAIEFFTRQTQSMIKGRRGLLYLFFRGHHAQWHIWSLPRWESGKTAFSFVFPVTLVSSRARNPGSWARRALQAGGSSPHSLCPVPLSCTFLPASWLKSVSEPQPDSAYLGGAPTTYAKHAQNVLMGRPL